MDTEICYVSASKAPWETLSKRSLPGRVAFLWSFELLAKALTEHPLFTRILATHFLCLQHVGGATFSRCGLDNITPLMPNQQPSLWSTVFLVTLELVYAPTCLLVSGESSHACLPYLSTDGATSHCGTTQGPSLFPNHMTFAFRTQCCPEGPGQSELSSHSVYHRTMSSGVRVHLGGSWELEEHPVKVLLLSSTSTLCSAICCIPLLTPTASGKHQDV